MAKRDGFEAVDKIPELDGFGMLRRNMSLRERSGIFPRCVWALAALLACQAAPGLGMRDVQRAARSNGWMNRRAEKRGARAFSLIELLCVIAIIAILTSMMLPAMGKALRKARGLGDHLGSPSGVEMRIDEVLAKYATYRAANPGHGPLKRKEFIRALGLSAQAEAWMNLASVEYRPFSGNAPPEQPVIIVYPSSGGGSGDVLAIFMVGQFVQASR